MIRFGSRAVLLALAVVLVAAAPVEGQRERRSSQDRERLEERVRARMGEMIRERLGLSEEEEGRLAEVTQSFEDQRRALFGQERALRREVEALRSAADAEPGAAADLLNRMIELRADEAELFAQEQAALLEILTPVQVLELHELREQIGRRIRDIRNGRRGEPDGRRRGRRGGGAELEGAVYGWMHTPRSPHIEAGG